MSDYDPVIMALDARFARQREGVREMLREAGRDDLLAEFDRKMRDIDTGVEGVRNCWHSISRAQRSALIDAARHGGRLVREDKEYRHPGRSPIWTPIRVRTVRVLCAHELLAWDGGAFDPEAAAVITERGLFVLKHGGGMVPT